MKSAGKRIVWSWRSPEWIYKGWMKAWVNMHCWHEYSHIKNPRSEVHRYDKVFPWWIRLRAMAKPSGQSQKLTVCACLTVTNSWCVCKPSSHSFLLPNAYSLRLLPRRLSNSSPYACLHNEGTGFLVWCIAAVAPWDQVQPIPCPLFKRCVCVSVLSAFPRQPSQVSRT